MESPKLSSRLPLIFKLKQFLPPLPSRLLFLMVLVAVLLRLLFFRFQILDPDSYVYGEIAKNWLLHGVYGLTPNGVLTPTLIRLPGYPAFLAAIFAIFGVEHYNAVSFLQIAIDVLTCFVTADLARRTVSKSASAIAFGLCATCPFLANYAGAVLTETLAIFFTALALDFAVAGLDAIDGSRASSESGSHAPEITSKTAPEITSKIASKIATMTWKIWAACGAAVAAGILLRPDGGILLIAIAGYLLFHLLRQPHLRRQTIAAGIILVAVSFAPLAPWTWRNWQRFHLLQPLAPTEANDPQEFVAEGFIRWERTWLVDYASKVDVSFNVDNDTINPSDLPSRATDSAEERRRTEQLFAEYNEEVEVTPELDQKFAVMAAQRIYRDPFRYYVWLPILRALDLWFRPRIENLPIFPHFSAALKYPAQAVITAGFFALNLWYCAVALLGLVKAGVRYAGLLVGFCVVRTVAIAVITFPEPRYVLECYPVVLMLAAATLAAFFPAASLSSNAKAQSVEISSQ